MSTDLTASGSSPSKLTAADAEAILNYDRLPDGVFVARAVVERVFGISTATVSRWVASGKIPPPQKFGRDNRWLVGRLRRAQASVEPAA